MSETRISISLTEYNSLREAAAVLAALHAGGADNWEGYRQSLEDAGLYDEEEEDLFSEDPED